VIRKFCDICEWEITDLSQLPTRKLFVFDCNGEYEMFVCNRCYKKMCRIIKRTNARERRLELKAIKNGEECSLEG
jgi:hypothetical protein